MLLPSDVTLDNLIYRVVQVPGTLPASSKKQVFVPGSLGQGVVNSFDVDQHGFFRMAESVTDLQGTIQSAYDDLQKKYPDSIRVVSGPDQTSATTGKRFLKSPFVPKDVLDIKKQYVAPDPSDLQF